MTPEQRQRLVAIRAQLAEGQGSHAFERGRGELWGIDYEVDDAGTEDAIEALDVLERFGLFAHVLCHGFLRTGDVVSFAPALGASEHVVVAWADYRRNRMSWLGWPAGEIAITRCRVESKISDDGHERAVAAVLAPPRSLGDELVRAVLRHHRPDLWRWIDAEVSRLQAAAAPTPEQAGAKAALSRLSVMPVHELAQAWERGERCEEEARRRGMRTLTSGGGR